MTQDRFKGSHFPKCIVLQAIYWYLRYTHDFHSVGVTLGGIEIVRMIRKGQMENQEDLRSTTLEIFYSPAI